ncbi:MAG: ester cyclase [Paracoccaceae bacterium]
MGDFQSEKQLVLAFHSALDAARPGAEGDVLAQFCTPLLRWRGYLPFGELSGTDSVAARFWAPLRRALTRLRRRPDIFFAGRNEIDGFQSVWVVSMGHLYGLFDQPWLGIAPTGKMAFLRYAEFHRVQDGRIVETAMYFDIPHLMIQAGLTPFAGQRGAHLVQPGPATHDGLLTGPQPAAEGEATLALINRMISDLGQWRGALPLEEELRRTWDEDMIWWGPAGIGATCTIERYAQQHSGPFRAAFSERSGTGHVARLAEGHFGGFFGWPNFNAVHSGSYLGIEPTGKRCNFTVIDIYRRSGDRLAENWVFIDIPAFLEQIGHPLELEAP